MWNHNSHFHSYLLRQIPKTVCRSLDVGCGLGDFSVKIAQRSELVDAIDVERAVLTEASILNPAPNICYSNADFLAADLPECEYDIIISIATLHHMDARSALEKMKLLLRPAGKLLIIGLYREQSPIDYLYSAVSVPLNFIYLQWHRASITRANARYSAIVPTQPPQLSLMQIEKVAATTIPGFRLKRHFLWRYSLVWQKL